MIFNQAPAEIIKLLTSERKVNVSIQEGPTHKTRGKKQAR